MNCNVGRLEQAARISAGVMIILAGLKYRNWWGAIGIAPILTGASRYCPLNQLLGIDNCADMQITDSLPLRIKRLWP